jgi:hypothetical protein
VWKQAILKRRFRHIDGGNAADSGCRAIEVERKSGN